MSEHKPYDLTIGERYAVNALLPTEANFALLRVIRDAQDVLSFSEAELKDYGIVVAANGQASWPTARVKDTSAIALSGRAAGLIRKKLEELDRQSKLSVEHFTLVEKFAPDLMQTE